MLMEQALAFFDKGAALPYLLEQLLMSAPQVTEPVRRERILFEV